MSLFQSNHLIVMVLVIQLILDPFGIAWSQAPSRGGKMGAGGGIGPTQGAGGSKIRPAEKAGSDREGVLSLIPAEEQLPGGQALSRAVVPEEYLLGPGDTLAINLWGEYEDSYRVKVAPDGKISLPTIGELKVNGLSLAKTEALVATEVKRFYRNVNSGVSLLSLRVFQVQVLGEVRAPGMYLATPVKRMSDVVAQAGGILPGGSQRYVKLIRDGGVYAEADLTAFLRRGDEAANPNVRDGDIVFVPPMGEMRIWAYISEITTASQTGAVSENSIPYTVELKKGERVSTLVSELGGSTPWWDLEGVFVQRISKSPEGVMRIPVNLKQYIIEGDESQNIVLEHGDQIYIPAITRRVFITGAVRFPAAYTYIPGRSVDSYISQAGGLSLTAEMDRSFIRRENGSVEPFIGTNELNNGDTVVVVEKYFKTYQDYFALMGAIAGVILSGVGMLAVFKIKP